MGRNGMKATMGPIAAQDRGEWRSDTAVPLGGELEGKLTTSVAWVHSASIRGRKYSAHTRGEGHVSSVATKI